MFSVIRSISLKVTSTRFCSHYKHQYKVHGSTPIEHKPSKHNEQYDYVRNELESHISDWAEFKINVLKKQGGINIKNIDGVLFKIMINDKLMDAAQSFATYLKKSSDNLSLGTLNGILTLYYETGIKKKLSDTEQEHILEIYTNLYQKIQFLDYTTGEALLKSLCVIDEWEKALKVLNDIHLSGTPSHLVYSTLIATLFKQNKRDEAFDLINRSITNKRPIQHIAYEAWINYILRQHKCKESIIKHLDELCLHISNTNAVVTLLTAEKIKQIYTSQDWKAQYAEIKRYSGLCQCCQQKLDCLLTENEFKTLQKTVKERIIVGSDLFLKSSPLELDRFIKFIKKTAPYDIVLDALNVFFAAGKANNSVKLLFLKRVIDEFLSKDKKILLLGRKHMLRWPKNQMEYLMSKTCYFFTDDLSQDDPYFITAAILSGSRTDILSKDLLRDHKFVLKDEKLQNIFLRWQWQHQWTVFYSNGRKPNIQEPLKFTPCAQKKNGCWHLPYRKKDTPPFGRVHDCVPDLTSWLCLRPKDL